MRTCTRCLDAKPDDQFNWRSQTKGTRQSACRDCQKKINLSHYYRNPKPYKKRARAAVNALKVRFVEWLRTKSCVDCGEDDPVVLDCDHREGTNKTPGGVNRMLKTTRPWAVVEAELAMCEIRCANCHRRKTARERGWVYRVM